MVVGQYRDTYVEHPMNYQSIVFVCLCRDVHLPIWWLVVGHRRIVEGQKPPASTLVLDSRIETFTSPSQTISMHYNYAGAPLEVQNVNPPSFTEEKQVICRQIWLVYADLVVTIFHYLSYLPSLPLLTVVDCCWLWFIAVSHGHDHEESLTTLDLLLSLRQVPTPLASEVHHCGPLVSWTPCGCREKRSPSNYEW